MKKTFLLTLLLALYSLTTVWAQDPVLKLTSEEIGTTYPYALTDDDAAKVFALTDLTIAVKVNTPASLSGRKALFCTSDPTQDANTSAAPTGSHYVAYGTSDANSSYLASCVTGDRFSAGSIPTNTEEVILVYILNSTENNYRAYIRGESVMDRNFGTYEIATPKMVKEDHPNAKIYIGGGVKSDNATFETFNGTITGVEVYDGVLTAEQVVGLFPAVFDPGKQYALKSPTGTYFNFTASGTTAATFQSAPSYFYITEESEAYIFESVDNPGTYIGCSSSNTWDVSATTTSTKWNISEADEDGYVTISKNSGTGNLGSDDNTEVGTGIYANVGDECFKWLIEEKAEDENENYTFAPEIGKMYALQESTSGLYLDIQTLGVKDGSRSGDNISLNIKPSIIFFEEGSTENTWKLKNANGKYVSKGSDGEWNPVIGDASHDWIIAIGANEQITIARATGEYINIEGGISAGKPLYNDKSTALQFSLIEYSDLNRNYCVLKSPSDTYLNLTQVGDTEVSFQSAASELYITPSADAFYLESKDNAGTFIGSTHNWNTTKDFSLWTISNKNDEGLVLISRNNATGEKINLGHDTSTDAGTGIFTNVGNGCFLWQIQESIDCPTAATIENDKYHFTSDRMWYTAPCNKLRFTLTKSGAFYKGGAKRLSFDSFVLYDANGNKVELTTDCFEGNNEGKDFSKMLDGANDDCCAGTWASGTESDWFEITLPNDVDLGGAFSFSFVTENTTMNAQAFRIDIKYGATFYTVADIVFPDGVAATTITYDGETVEVGDRVKEDITKFTPTEIDEEYVLDFIKDEEAQTIVLIYRKGYYRLAIDAPQNVEVTYDGQSLEADGKIRISTFNSAQFEATDIDGYKWDVVVDETNATVHLVYSKTHYTFAIDAPQSVEVTYNGNSVAADATFEISTFNAHYFNAPEIEGYYWEIVVDEANATATLKYTQGSAHENPTAVVELAKRIGGTEFASKFKFVLDRTISSLQETFVLGNEEGKILIKGSTLSAITTGLGWYLNNVAHINIAWNSLNEKTVSGDTYVNLTNITLPLPSEETHVSDAKYRYYLNTCTFGYSMTSWTWKRWQQEIDWMALHGINMPLQLVGLEEVWRTFLTMEKADGTRKYGYTDEEAKAFVAGPAFIAWWAMNNLEGWGGTGSGTKSGATWEGAGGVQDDAWYARQKNLAKQIVEAQRALGMQPVLPGWSGMVPTNFASKSGYATRGNGGNWAGEFVRPLLLSVSNSNYAEIAADYYACLEAVMGESQYYSMDPFHEGGGAGTTEDYAAMYEAMEAAKAGSQWVIQQWQWTSTQRLSLTAVPEGRLIVLDLFADGKPAFDSYNGYDPQDAVFCAIPNFGGRSGLMGRLQNVTDNYFKYKDKYASIKGIGAAPEAIEQTPVTYDLIFQLPWMNGVKPDVAKWVDNYSIARYGKDNAITKEAWNLLRQSVLAYGADGIEGPIEDVWAARPNLKAWYVSSWGSTLSQSQKGINVGNTYTPARRQMLIDAVYKLIDQKDALALEAGSVYESNYMYDLVEFGGGVMADYAHDLLLGINEAKTAAGANFATDPTYIARRDAFLQLILDMDAFKGTNLNFRLGKWTQEARDAAAEVTGATTATPDWYEYNNARTIVSTWSSPGTNLTDYSYRSWQGLLKDYYLPRWEYYFNEIEAGRTPNGDNYKFFEWNWAHGMKHEVGQTAVSNVPLAKGEAGHTDSYTREPEGNTVETAVEMLGKYIIPVAMADGVHYAYRYLTNDLSNKVTIIAMGGGTIDLTKYFGTLEGATVTGDFIDGEATDLANIAVKSNLTEEAYTGTITLADGTVLTFAVSLNPDYYGVYRIKREGKPVFIGYHDWNISNDNDNGGVIGYKLLDPNGGKYTATATADEFITIVPSGSGYSISAQGQYLMSPTYSAWNHLLFSENKGDAGVYVFEETTTADLFKIKSPTSGDAPINYVNSYGNAFGNDKADKSGLSTFTIEEVESYPLTVTAAGMATLCLPFNVVLPKGVTAYDLVVSKIVEENDAQYVAYLQSIATSDKILKAGTPVIVKAEQGSYDLAITMSNENAVSSLANSLLKGNFVSQTLTQGTDVKKFIFANGTQGVGFYIMDAEGTIGANKCWMEWAMPADANVRSLVLRFSDEATDIEYVAAPQKPAAQAIYNLAGQRLAEPQKGVNIINGKKVVIK